MKKLINLDFDLNESCQNLTMFQKSKKREIIKFMKIANFNNYVTIVFNFDKESKTIFFMSDLDRCSLSVFIQNCIEKVREEKGRDLTFKYSIHSIN